MAAQVGSAYISIRPDLTGVHQKISKDLRAMGPQIKKIGVDLGKNMASGFKVGFGNPLSGPLDDSSKKERSKAPKRGEDVAGAFAKGFEKRLKSAFESLPKAKIDADSSEADKKIAALRARMEELSGKTIGVDIDANAALAELETIRGELDTLSGSESIQVRVDVAAAIAELAAVQAQADRLDGRTARVNVNANVAPALAGIGLVSTALLGLTAIPVGATLGAGILSLSGPLAAAGVGFAGLAAVAVPSINNIGEALQVQKQAQQASTGSAAQAAAANEKLAASMAALSPAERGLLKSFTGLRTAFTGWAKDLQPDVLPLFTRGINLVKSALPSLTPIVKGAADSVGGLLTKVQGAAKSPFWQQLRADITTLVPTSITGFGTAAGGVATGLAGVVSAFLPFAPQILSFITRITTGFANWGKSLGTSSGFAAFIDFVKTNLPVVLQSLTQLGATITHVVSSLAPLGPVALGGFGLLLKLLGGLKPGEIQALAIGIGLIVAATKAWSIAQLALNLAMDANPIVLVIVGLVALGAALVLAFNHVGWFHDAVVAAWNGIKTAALFVWNSILKPVFGALVTAVTAVATAATWLWKNVLVPAFTAISLAARLMFAIVATVVLVPLMGIFNLLKAAVLLLWHVAIVPAFIGIKTAISAAWTVIKPLFDLWVLGMHLVGDGALWLWHNAIVPAWHAIGTAISAVYNNVIRPVFSALNSVIRGVIAPVFRWIYNSVIKPIWSAVGAGIKAVWDHTIRPAFNALKSGLHVLQNAFGTAVDAIGKIWKKIEGITKKPVQFVVNVVYDKIASVWNKVAGVVGLKQYTLPSVKFAQGGIFPGYTPGRDPYSMPMAAFSGGEAVMRPEFTRALGPGFVHGANKAARQRGVGGVRDYLANGDLKFARGGILPGATVAHFAGGGILGGVLGAVKKAGSLVVHGAASFLDAGASAFASHILKPILSHVPGADSRFAEAIYSMPKTMIDGFIKWLKVTIDPRLSGDAHGVVAAAKKYIGIGDDRGHDNDNRFTRQWGYGAGTPWCALFASTAIKDAKAGKYYAGYPTAAVAGFNGRMRHVPTGSGRPGDLGVYGGGAHVNIIEKKQGSGYMTIGGNQNSLVQRGVRGGQTSMLRPTFATGGILSPKMIRTVFHKEAPRNADPHEMGTPLVSLLSSLSPAAGAKVYNALGRKGLQITNAGVYDNGGVVTPGLNLIANASRRPEALLSNAQWSAITRAADSSGGEAAPVIGTVLLQTPPGATVREVIDELSFGVRRARLGGPYSRG